MNHTPIDHTILTLSLIEGLGPVAINQLIALIIGEQITEPSALSAQGWIALGCAPKIAQKITGGFADFSNLEKELELINKNSISLLTIADQSYPAYLKAIYAPPPILYWQGAHPNSFDKTLAIVGSRQATSYAQQVISQTVPTLIEHDWTIVSGGAIGADSMAHRTTLDHKGTTIAVLGSGLLKPYPVSNRRLFEEIIAGRGTLLSSFPLLTEAFPGNFPARNRIIAGLSQGCMVVQAAQKSGARITAQFALDEGRSVFAVPGLVNDPLSQGCHALIREGAVLARDVNDILIEFGEYRVQEQQMSIKPATTRDHLLSLCAQPHSLDELAIELNSSAEELQSELFTLQIEGKIEQQFTGKWVRV